MDLKNKLHVYLTSMGYHQIENEISNSFGDFCNIYSNGQIRIRIVSDRSTISIDISRKNSIYNWYDLGIIKALIDNEKSLTSALSEEESIVFLISHFTEICRLFSLEQFPITKKALETLEQKRAEQMFPIQ